MKKKTGFSDSLLAIQRTTPVLLGLFSLVTLLAHRLFDGQPANDN